MKSALLLAAAVAYQFASVADSYEDYIGSGPGKVPGAVVIGCANGKITTQCFGYADVASKTPMSADTVGWLASNTKAIAYSLVLSYVEEGELALDEPISRCLPEWQGDKVPTLRQCMSHGGAWSTWGCAYRASGIARVFFVQHAGGESKGYEEFRTLVDKNAETSYSPSKL